MVTTAATVTRTGRRPPGGSSGAGVACHVSLVDGSVGQSGRNEDYVHNTVEHLRALNIRDQWLEDVAERVGS